MQKEIGSNFWLTPEELTRSEKPFQLDVVGFYGNDSVWMSTGRSAISIVLDTIMHRNPKHNKVAIIPPFTCDTVIKPFINKGYKIITYRIDTNLFADGQNLVDLAVGNNACVVLIHRYFGFDTISKYDDTISELRKLGVTVIEDCTQNLYSTFEKSIADYIVGSIRKWCGVPDGGFAICKEGQFDSKPTMIDTELRDTKKKASISKFEYLYNGIGEKQEFLQQYREAEDILNKQSQYYTISDLSVRIQSNLDIEELIEKRRSNYEALSCGLKGIDDVKVVFPVLPNDVVPLYCPVVCVDRAKTQTILVQHSIYAPVVWPKTDCCPPVDQDTDYLYSHLLCIPIDQRYDEDDMKRIIDILK